MRIAEVFSRDARCGEKVQRPYVIAEAGVNHEGKMELARRLIDEAAEGGAHAIKFQTYRADTIASKHSPSYWDLTKEPTRSQHELFQKYDKFWKSEFEQLKQHCVAAGIEFLSTPFDIESATFLNDLMDVFKVSSSDITNKPFIEFMCGFGKPIILSTGASHLWEIEQAVGWIEKQGNDYALLHCVLNYPTEDESANLGMILSLCEKFPGSPVGYSDHTLPGDMQVLEVAILLGAQILEKHFTFDKTLPGNDHYHAMDKDDLKRFNERLGKLFTLLGSFHKEPLSSEAAAIANARRSLVAARIIPAGKAITVGDLTWKRPAHGISPREIDAVLGRVAVRDISEDELLQWGMLS
jgi:N-acetylneuraminate synthase